MGSEVLWKIFVTQHSLRLHQEMQLEIVLCKEEGIYKFCPETPPSSLGPEMDRKTVETGSLVRRVLISACFWEKTDIGFYVPKMEKTIQTKNGQNDFKV